MFFYIYGFYVFDCEYYVGGILLCGVGVRLSGGIEFLIFIEIVSW